MYHQVTEKLPTFDVRIRDGICLGHDSGGVYIVLTKDGTFRAKHVRAIEDDFPVISLFDTIATNMDHTSNSSDEEHLDIMSDDNTDGGSSDVEDSHEQYDDDGAAASPVDPLTYIPTEPSTYDPDQESKGEEYHSDIEYATCT